MTQTKPTPTIIAIAVKRGDGILRIINALKRRLGIRTTSDVVRYCLNKVHKEKE